MTGTAILPRKPEGSQRPECRPELEDRALVSAPNPVPQEQQISGVMQLILGMRPDHALPRWPWLQPCSLWLAAGIPWRAVAKPLAWPAERAAGGLQCGHGRGASPSKSSIRVA